ncbi:MAG: rod shape-determining protein RodA [Deltaproteobacteria bacterium]|nr:rod shape-determining protein RodA [Deltaproteobacteria bacterium]
MNGLPFEERMLFGTMVLLVLIGLSNLYSALHLWGGGGHMALFWLQLAWIAVGSGIGWLLGHYDYRLLHRSCGRWHLIATTLLVLVLFVGRDISGHRSWFAIGGFGIQPSEFVKITTIFVLARFFTDHLQPHGFGLRDLWEPLVAAGGPALLILLQGDLGTTLFMLLVTASMILFAKLRRGTFILFLVVFLTGGGFAYQKVLTPAQRGRIVTFLNPEEDPQGRGYHLLQSKIAVGSGGWLGRGYLKGQVNKLRYLPEKHTDFIFPVLAEEWGFFGSLFTIVLFFTLITLGLTVARQARDRFGGLLAMGMTFWLFWQVAINLGGVLGLMPLTGVTLPFLSYGGSSMVVAFVAMGLLISISRRRFLF